MELIALDADFGVVAPLPYINLQWSRAYYEPGTFSVQIRAEDYDPEMRYIFAQDRPETGMIQKVQLSESIKGRFCQLDGFFLEAILNDKIVYPTFHASGQMGREVAEMLNAYKADIPRLVVDTPTATGDSYRWQVTGKALGSAAFEHLQEDERSLRCLYDFPNDTIHAQIWQGVDRTDEIIFSDGLRNLTDVLATVDISDARNFAVVGGQGEGPDRVITTVDLSDGGYRREVFIDADDIQQGEDQSMDDYVAELQTRGALRLLELREIRNVEVTPSAEMYRYLEDYDLGDRVSVIVEDIGLTMTARIIKVFEVHKDNTESVTIELGDKILTRLEKVRL